ncbi:MAG: hypothetical protein H0T46_13850 [Deltaproteobacteria bacterium]|nr:hypothetical protein [Deltaproteobacteria bacterium]
MASWPLVFESTVDTPEPPVSIESCAAVVAEAVGADVITEVGELSGNPRDAYQRGAWVTGHVPGTEIRLELSTTQWAYSPGDAHPQTGILYVALGGPPATFTARVAVWHALRDGLARLAYVDRTFTKHPARIVDDADAAGEMAAAARLRAEIREALIAEAYKFRVVWLVDTRVDDIEAVLAAYPDPDKKDEVTLENCKLGALPAGCGRFTNIQALTFIDSGSDINALRMMKLPRLTKLSFARSGITRLTRDDVAGLPLLTELDVSDSRLAELDPAILDRCPRLQRVKMRFAPLQNFSALREAWPNVSWE